MKYILKLYLNLKRRLLENIFSVDHERQKMGVLLSIFIRSWKVDLLKTINEGSGEIFKIFLGTIRGDKFFYSFLNYCLKLEIEWFKHILSKWEI